MRRAGAEQPLAQWGRTRWGPLTASAPPRRGCEVEFLFPEGDGSEAAGRRVDGLAFVNEDVVGE